MTMANPAATRECRLNVSIALAPSAELYTSVQPRDRVDFG